MATRQCGLLLCLGGWPRLQRFIQVTNCFTRRLLEFSKYSFVISEAKVWTIKNLPNVYIKYVWSYSRHLIFCSVEWRLFSNTKCYKISKIKGFFLLFSLYLPTGPIQSLSRDVCQSCVCVSVPSDTIFFECILPSASLSGNGGCGPPPLIWHWLSLTVNENHWQSLTVNEIHWQSLRVTESHCHSLTVTGRHWLSLRVTKSHWQYWQSLTVIDIHQQSLTFTDSQ